MVQEMKISVGLLYFVAQYFHTHIPHNLNEAFIVTHKHYHSVINTFDKGARWSSVKTYWHRRLSNYENIERNTLRKCVRVSNTLIYAAAGEKITSLAVILAKKPAPGEKNPKTEFSPRRR